jgi:hypothetical protein
MTLDEFLATHELEAVELLPDDRLINVVVDGGALHAVAVESIPSGVQVTRLAAALAGTTIAAGGLTFDTPDYVMLSNEGPSEDEA